jgi:hypothetical protein
MLPQVLHPRAPASHSRACSIPPQVEKVEVVKMGLWLGQFVPAPAGALSFLLRRCEGAAKAASTEGKALLS